MSKFKKMLTGTLIVVMVLAMGSVGAFASSTDTVSRGYQMINGNVCDLSGNLLLPVKNGMVLGGYTLSPDFRVYYPQKTSNQAPALRSTSIYSGTKALALNVDGKQGRAVGLPFVMTESAPNVVCTYVSGDPTGVNFAIVDADHDTAVAFVPNVQPGDNTGALPVYNSAQSGDRYQVQASAAGSAGGSGNAYMTIVAQ